jgi:hypothetical protein
MTKQELLTECNAFGVDVPRGASKGQIEALLDDFYIEEGLVSKDAVPYLESDEPSTVYIVEFTNGDLHKVMAESISAARKWIESIFCCGCIGEIVSITECQVEDCCKVDEGDDLPF